MNEHKESTIGDLLGVAPVGRAIERVTDSVMGGAEAVLGRVCLPAAEELGLLFRDKVGVWRQRNVVRTVERAQDMLTQAAAENRHGPPRLIMESLSHASWSDNEDIQQMWAGLLASSCTPDGADDSNWIFINLLGQLTSTQAAILRFSCETSPKLLFPTGLIGAGQLRQSAAELFALTGCSDIHRIDRELDHLRTLGLIQFGFNSDFPVQPTADIQPTALALHLYVRVRGSQESPVDFFRLQKQDESKPSA